MLAGIADMDLSEAARHVQRFEQGDVGRRLAQLETQFRGRRRDQVRDLCEAGSIGLQLLESAFALKRVAGQINVLIHGLGILAALPHILVDGETVEDLSLGAGNTGRAYDLETNRRIAEFKFIQWRGGPEAIRQNTLFKDFYTLAEADTPKEKFIYLLELDRPIQFLNGRRALGSVLSKDHALRTSFEQRYGSRFQTVREYFEHRRSAVTLVDLTLVVPGFSKVVAGFQDMTSRGDR